MRSFMWSRKRFVPDVVWWLRDLAASIPRTVVLAWGEIHERAHL